MMETVVREAAVVKVARSVTPLKLGFPDREKDGREMMVKCEMVLAITSKKAYADG